MYKDIVEKQRYFFNSGVTKDIEFRINSLEKLRAEIRNNEKELLYTLNQDLNKSEFEAYSTEIGIILEELRFTIKNLKQWAKPTKVKTPVTHLGSSSYIISEPYGVTLIISPWNYPFQLAIAPLIGSIAAGNCSVLKPSELTPKTSKLLKKIITNIFQEDFVTVVEGGIDASQRLLNEKFDYIFFTGSVPVGKVIMESAAKHLTPVTLELGGKSPCIVHEDANLKIAAKRIAWGKFMNAGQTCVAPDYIYVHEKIKDEFLSELKSSIRDLYGNHPLANEHYTRIVSLNHFLRLKSFLDNGDILIGGKLDEEKLVIEPTVITNISWNDAIMQDEIFGPILPVLEYDSINSVIRGINNHPKPLALYVFTETTNIHQEIVNQVSFGGGCVNDTIYHIVSPYLPFGGVGNSGIGSYHGKGSFDTFSHKKSILYQTTKFDIPFRYPNVKNALQKLKLFLK